jgi:hypothetical protein
VSKVKRVPIPCGLQTAGNNLTIALSDSLYQVLSINTLIISFKAACTQIHDIFHEHFENVLKGNMVHIHNKERNLLIS